MKTTLTTAALLAALATVPGVAGAAAPGYYEGKTDGGQKISFKVSKSGAVSAIDGLVPTSCVNTVGKPPRAGAELFKPPGTYRVVCTR